jgi:arylsulfatase
MKAFNTKILFIQAILALGFANASSQVTIDDHTRAVHLLPEVGMRDPYIVIDSEGVYHLTYTVMDNQHRQAAGHYTSTDLQHWKKQDYPYTLSNSSFYDDYLSAIAEKNDILKLWAPEFHFINGRWVIVHTSNVGIPNFAITDSNQLETPYTDWGNVMGRRHDPNLFQDENGSVWLVWGASFIQKIKNDLSGYDEAEGTYIPPSNRKVPSRWPGRNTSLP